MVSIMPFYIMVAEQGGPSGLTTTDELLQHSFCNSDSHPSSCAQSGTLTVLGPKILRKKVSKESKHGFSRHCHSGEDIFHECTVK